MKMRKQELGGAYQRTAAKVPTASGGSSSSGSSSSGNRYLYEKLLRGREAVKRGGTAARDLVEEDQGRA